jgi:hypothetical protein
MFRYWPFLRRVGHVVCLSGVFKMNAELLEHVATICYRILATGKEIQKRSPIAIFYFADMRKLRLYKKEDN